MPSRLSLRCDVVGDGPRAVPCDPEDFAFHPCLSVFICGCFLSLPLPFAFAFYPVHPTILYNGVQLRQKFILILIVFAFLFYYHIIIREKTLDTVFLIAYN